MRHDAIPGDDDFPQLAVILDRKRFASVMQRALRQVGADVEVRRVKVRRVYYRPDRSCRLLVECRLAGTGAGEVEQLYFGKIQRDDAREPAPLPGRADLTQPAMGPPWVAIPALRLDLCAYPNDPDLPGLAFLADSRQVLGWLQRNPSSCGLPKDATVLSSSADLAKYVPGQRVGFRYALRWRNGQGVERTHRAYAKGYQASRGEAAAWVLRQIEGTEACRSGVLRIPRLFAFDARRDILWQEFLSGTKLSKDESARGLLRHAAAAGRALAAFHASTLRLGPGKDLASQVKDLHKARAALARSYPAWGELGAGITERLLATVAELPPIPVAPVHGSFKSSHLFEEQGRVALIDFDGAGLGDPMYDVGRFLARVVAGGAHTEAAPETIQATLERFRQAYAGGVPWGWPEARVRWSTCAHLIASQAYKSVKRANMERVAATVRVAAAWLPNGATQERTT